MPSVTRKSSSSRQARREAIVKQMLGVVEELLSEGESFTELSVERLIGSAGISRSTFYVYFEDKGTLLLALAEDVVQQLVGSAQAWWELPPTATKADVEAALRGTADVFREHAAIWSSLVDASSYDQKVRASFRAVVDNAAAGLAKHIKDGQKSGSVVAGLDPKRTAEWLTWMTERGLYQLLAEATDAETTKSVRAQADIVWNTLYAGAPSRAAAA
ncbi:MAG: TetR family transcriptional regulator [Solirubrobacterales bacterium]|jgi:AcrR family transcriptional regulator|nr:TetR family transcriptional regulator [Solirubrobacterales bacterium]